MDAEWRTNFGSGEGISARYCALDEVAVVAQKRKRG
jgi:hypothetical protein